MTSSRLGWRDIVGLACLLLAILSLMPTGPFTTDEGEVMLQLDLLADSGRWEAPYPAGELDPTGVHMPVHQIERDGDRFLPHVKHPAWTAALVPVFEVGGLTGVIAAHLACLVVAAVGAACLARRLGSRRERQVFWLVGIASPVTVGAFVAWGHAPGVAAATVGIALLATPSSAPSRSRQAAGWVVGAAAIFVGVLIRNEVVLVGAALGLALSLRRQWRPAMAAWLATGASYALNTALIGRVWGPNAFAFQVIDHQAGWLSGRVTGLSRSLMGFEPTVPALLVALGSVLGCWFTARSERTTAVGRLGRLLVVSAPLATVALWPVAPVAGLLVVCPALLVGAVATGMPRWRGLVHDEAGAVLVTVVIGVGLVLATQYSDGGGLQWGGRFLQVLVPAALALLVVGIDHPPVGPLPAVEPRATRAGMPVSVAVAAVLWTFAGLLSVANLRAVNATIVDAVVTQARDDADAGGVDGLPVVMGDFRVLGALMWEHLGELRAMDVRQQDLDDMTRRLEHDGIDRWTLVWSTSNPPRRIGAYDAVDRRIDPTSSLWLLSMERR